MKTCCYDDHLPYTLWCSCKDLAWSSRGPWFESQVFFLALIRPIIITLINFLFFYFYSGWSLGVTVLGIHVYTMGIIFFFTVDGAWVWLFRVYVRGVISGQFFLLSVSARLKKITKCKNKSREEHST